MSEEKETLTTISKTLNQFSLKLYKKLSAGKDENFFISPFSISTALTMCYTGAANKTAEQLKDLLNLTGLSNEQILELNSKYSHHLNNLGGSVKLSTANKIYPKEGSELKAEFTSKLAKYFESQVEPLDFGKSAESAKIVNDWVAKQTHDKIKDIVNEKQLTEETRLVLVNAIYFKADWRLKFKEANTREEDFNLTDGTKKKVKMMSLMDKSFAFSSNPAGLKAKTCTLPYQNNSTAMTIILPDKGVKVEEIEKNLTGEVLGAILTAEPKYVDVNLYVPKFKLEYKSELQDQLSELGAPLAFSQLADFSGMVADPKGVYISHVIHQSFVDVNEDGTEAAAATVAMHMLGSCLRRGPEPEEFKCNRPFLFIIHDTQNKGILFVGKYARPN